MQIQPKEIKLWKIEDEYEDYYDYNLELDDFNITITKEEYNALEIKYSKEELVWACNSYQSPVQVYASHITNDSLEYFTNEQDARERYKVLRKAELNKALENLAKSKEHILKQLEELEN